MKKTIAMISLVATLTSCGLTNPENRRQRFLSDSPRSLPEALTECNAAGAQVSNLDEVISVLNNGGASSSPIWAIKDGVIGRYYPSLSEDQSEGIFVRLDEDPEGAEARAIVLCTEKPIQPEHEA